MFIPRVWYSSDTAIKACYNLTSLCLTTVTLTTVTLATLTTPQVDVVELKERATSSEAGPGPGGVSLKLTSRC